MKLQNEVVGQARPLSVILQRPLFTVAIFLSSFLLFLIQPMIARLILPKLGGAPSVWNVAMLFYQALLLAGYSYAHVLTNFRMRTQVVIHGAALMLAAMTLPVGLAMLKPATEAQSPILWMIGLLAASIGPIFFVVSAQAPLLQSWFTRSTDSFAQNPYFLYSASNAGSFLALFAYPLAVEPMLNLGHQTNLWSGAFLLLAIMIIGCGLLVAVRTRDPSAPLDQAPQQAVGDRPSWRERLNWIVLSAIPSGLLLSTTTHLTTDIMAMPLLWVIPLALYLLTFVLVFGDRLDGINAHARRIAPICIIMLAWSIFLPVNSIPWLAAGLSLLSFFYIVLALHGRLAASRPGAVHLTEFYFWMSLGGAIGGAFCAIIAPIIFNWTYEHPLLLLLSACFVRGEQVIPRASRFAHSNIAVVGALVAAVSLSVAIVVDSAAAWIFSRAIIAIVAALMIEQTAAFSVCVALLMLAGGGWGKLVMERSDFSTRSFFGTYFVRNDDALNMRMFVHGTTVHGMQSLSPDNAYIPTSYYGPGSGVGQVLNGARNLFPRARAVGIVGLGIGTLACYKRPGELWTAFEIDPKVVSIARDAKFFSFMSHCGADIRVEVGDGRILLEKVKPGTFDILAIDAFSSDAIPLHLMTAEAFHVYERALTPDGILLIHITNRHLDLEPVVAAVANANGWSALIRRNKVNDGGTGPVSSDSRWVAMARTNSRLTEIAQASGVEWDALKRKEGLRPWTDDWASVLPVLTW